MPAIDPAALSRPEPISTADPASLLLSKAQAHGITALPLQKVARTATNVQRIDLEPLYTSLKTAIGDNWTAYKEAIGLFVLGGLNQSELSIRIDHYVCADTSTEHLHNQLLSAIYGNVGRDLPEPGVAPWVSATDKPTAVSKPVSGDAAEQRLKTEVMQLPARDRRRLKEIPDPNDMPDHMTGPMNDYRSARGVRLPDAVPPSAGGLNKTNWDLEIRKRYQQPLASETGEFPDADSIHNRMLPICYEEALPNGCAATCAEFMAAATEQYLKEVIGKVLARTRSNVVSGGVSGSTVVTRKYRQQLAREEAALEKGQLARSPTSYLLPVEAKEAATMRAVGMSDLRLALEVGDCSLGQMPDVIQHVMGGWPDGVLEGWGDLPKGSEEADEEIRRPMDPPRTNGVLSNGVHMNGMGKTEDNESYGWSGGGADDRKQLFSVLDQCLSIGQ